MEHKLIARTSDEIQRKFFKANLVLEDETLEVENELYGASEGMRVSPLASQRGRRSGTGWLGEGLSQSSASGGRKRTSLNGLASYHPTSSQQKKQKQTLAQPVNVMHNY